MMSGASLDFRSLGDRVEQLHAQVERIELRMEPTLTTCASPTGQHLGPYSDSIELGIIKQRLLRLEGLLDGKKPAISFPPLGMIELAGRLEEVEANCSRLASDSFAAVESMHQKLDEVSNSFPQAWKEDFAEFDKRISNTLNESISKIAGVMSKLVDAQKSLRKNRASTSIQPVALIDRQEALEGLYQEIQYLRQRERHN